MRPTMGHRSLRYRCRMMFQVQVFTSGWRGHRPNTCGYVREMQCEFSGDETSELSWLRELFQCHPEMNAKRFLPDGCRRCGTRKSEICLRAPRLEMCSRVPNNARQRSSG